MPKYSTKSMNTKDLTFSQFINLFKHNFLDFEKKNLLYRIWAINNEKNSKQILGPTFMS